MKECSCPWCEKKYLSETDEDSTLCNQCREDLLRESKESLVNMLGYLAGANSIAMAALRTTPQLLEEFGIVPFDRAGSLRRKLTLKELNKSQHSISSPALNHLREVDFRH